MSATAGMRRRTWLLVSGDFREGGGQGVANLRLADALAREATVHVVAHSVDAGLAARPGVHVRLVRRPLGSDMLGEPVLRRAGRREAARLSATAAGAELVVVGNGGCLDTSDVSWVHCVQAARVVVPVGGVLRRMKARWAHGRALRAERCALRAARVVVCNSARTARDVVERVGVPADRVRVVLLAASADRFGEVAPEERADGRRALGRAGTDERPVALFVGTLGDRGKGFDVLYAAWRTLCADPAWDVDLAVVGVGTDRRVFERRVRADGLAARVRFLGARSDVPTLLAGADVLVHPARYDAYGLVVHEAVCRGAPVIVSAAAGVSERLPPTCADWILADADDEGALVGRLRAWRADLVGWAVRARALGVAWRARTWDDMAREFRDACAR